MHLSLDTTQKRHMQFLTPAPNFCGGWSVDSLTGLPEPLSV